MKYPKPAMLLALWALASGIGSSQTLFQDKFDRAENRNIDATLDGIIDNTGSNLVADGVYTHSFIDPNNAPPTYGVQDAVGTNGGGARILDNKLQMAVGAGTANAVINHNFINPEILSAGGFSVNLDISSYANGSFEFGGAFAIGMSSAEAASAKDAFDGAGRLTGGFGQGIGAAVPAASVSDFWIVLRGNNTLVWGGHSGTVQGVTGLAAKTGSIRVAFTFSDFNAGSTVGYEVFYNGGFVGSGSFQWSGTDENYIGLDARDATGVSFDNFEIRELGTEVVLTADPAVVSSVGSSEFVGLDWSVLGDLPSGATYEILDGSMAVIDSGSAAGGAGSFDADTDGRDGGETFTINILNASTEVIATDTASVTVRVPDSTSSQSVVRLSENGSPQTVSITIDGTFFPSDGTYEITDDNGAAVSYLDPTTGTITSPLFFDVDVDPTQGSVTFTVLLKDSDGTVFDTQVFTVDAVSEAPPISTVLFADSYDRFADAPDLNDIDSSSTGMTGSLAPLSYLEVWEGNDSNAAAPGVAKPESIQITSLDSLQAATGLGMSAWALDHNFIDAPIATDGTLSVSWNVLSIAQPDADDLPDRYVGFGLGMSLDEVAAMVDDSAVTGLGPRGAVNLNVSRGMADFYVSVAGTDNIQIFANGIVVAEIPVDGDGTFGVGGFDFSGLGMRVDLAFEDPAEFHAGSYAYYHVYCNELLVDSGYFQLTRTGSNYIAFSGRAATYVEVDNLTIGTVSAADLPYPGNPVDDAASVMIGNTTTDVDGVATFDLSVEGVPGVFYEIEKSLDLAAFTGFGTPGDGLVNRVSATVFGEADEQGDLSLQGLPARNGYEATGFYRARSFHWPAQ